MISKLYHITVGHYNVAVEHCNNNNINHTPTMIQALLTTIHDTLFNSTVYCNESKSYVVYETINKRTLGIKAYLVVSMYTPPKYRGKGYISKLLDKVPTPTVVSIGEDCNEIGRLYTRRKFL